MALTALPSTTLPDPLANLQFNFEHSIPQPDLESAAAKLAGHGRNRTTVCRFWLQGRCMKPERCTYLHVVSGFALSVLFVQTKRRCVHSMMKPACQSAKMEPTALCRVAPLCTSKRKKRRHAMHLGEAFVTMAACANSGERGMSAASMAKDLRHLRNPFETQA